MINGATEIIAGVPGKHLDPLLLAQSQTSDSVNFMVIAYGTQTQLGKERFFDLLFLRGSTIFDCARLNQDVRFRLKVEKAMATFKSRSGEEGTKIHFYKASQDAIERFWSTFYYEPCLKIQLDALTRKQLQKVLSYTGCRHGIIECDEFSQSVPRITLEEIRSTNELGLYVPISMKGLLLLYDIDRNDDLIQERYDSGVRELPSQLQNARKRSETLILRKVNPDNSNEGNTQQLEMLNEANQFTELVKQILNAHPSKSDFPVTPELEFPQGIAIKKTDQDHPPQTEDANTQASRTRRASRRSSKKSHGETTGKVPTENTNSQQRSEMVVLFERTFRSFRRVLYECLGEKCEAVIAQAENHARLLHPDFTLTELHDEVAIVVLDVIEDAVKSVPLLKRSRVRHAVMILIADVYNKQYDLLERSHVLDRVERFYYELKR